MCGVSWKMSTNLVALHRQIQNDGKTDLILRIANPLLRNFERSDHTCNKKSITALLSSL